MPHSILILGNYPPPYGGVGHHIDRLTEHLSGNGWTCYVLAGGTLGTARRGALTVSKPTWRQKGWGAVATSVRPGLWRWTAESALWRNDARTALRHRMYLHAGERALRQHRFDLIASYNLLAYSPVGDMLARRFGLPHVVNVFGEVFKSEALRRDAAFFRAICERATAVLSCSAHCANSLRLIDTPPARVVLYGVNLGHFHPGQASDAVRAQVDAKGEKVVLFVGRLGREMGLDSFLQAYRLLEGEGLPVRFVAIGQAAELLEEAQALASSSRGKLTVVSNVPYADIPEYYRLADVVAVPTRGARTCSSLAAMEGMATGKPVVAFDLGGIPEVVQHGRTGILTPAEGVRELADGIRTLVQNHRTAAAYGAAGLVRARAEFDEDRVGRVMEEIFIGALQR